MSELPEIVKSNPAVSKEATIGFARLAEQGWSLGHLILVAASFPTLTQEQQVKYAQNLDIIKQMLDDAYTEPEQFNPALYTLPHSREVFGFQT